MRRLICLVSFVLVGIAAFGSFEPSWQYDSPSPIVFEPTVAGDGSVYFATADAKLRSLTPKGVLAWKVKPGGQVITPIVLQNGVLYFANSAHQIRAYGRNGKMIWKVNLEVNADTPLAVSENGRIFFGSEDGDLYCVNANTADVAWHLHIGFKTGPPTIGHDGTVYIAGDNFVHAVNPATGHVKWRKNFFNYSRVPIAMDQYDDLFYNRGGILDVFDSNGNFLWEARNDKGELILIQKVSPLIYGDILIAADDGGNDIRAYDVSTGALLWTFSEVNTDWSPQAPNSMAVDRDGLVAYCDGTQVIAWFDGVYGYFWGYMPSIGTGNDVTLTGNGVKGRIVIRTGPNATKLVAYGVPVGPSEGPWSQGGTTAQHVQRRDDAPYIDIISPADGSTITGSFTAQVTASDDFQLKSLELYIGTTKVAVGNHGAIDWTTDSSVFQDGTYTFTALAKDSAGNLAAKDIDVSFTNPTPVYPMSGGAPVFTWLSNGVDTKYQVNIAGEPTFGSIIVSSASQGRKWKKKTSWQPGKRKWKKVLKAAANSPSNQVTFYWRALGKTGGLVVSKMFILDKTQ